MSPRVKRPITYSLSLLLFCLITFSAAAQQIYNPIRYYTFDNANIGDDFTNNSDLDFQYYGSGYTVGQNGPVNNYLTMGTSGNLVKGGNVDVSDELTIEFLFKPGRTFNNTEFIRRRDKGFEIAFDFPDQTRLYARIKFRTKYIDNGGNTVDDSFIIDMDGIGLKDWGYYADGNWHHLCFKFNGTTGTKEVWVDGMLASGFTKSVPTGALTPLGSPPELWFNNITDYRRLFGHIDEFAIYDHDIPPSLIYKHVLNVQQGSNYSFVDDYNGALPQAPPVTAGIDIEEYAPGHPNVNVTAKDQLYNFPTPRYKDGHDLKGNFQWFDPGKLAGYQTSNYSTTQIRHNMLAIQKELAKNYNYLLLASGNTIDNNNYNDSLTLAGASLKLANDNPQWGASAITFWPQINPTHAGYSYQYAYIESQHLPIQHYLRDSSGALMSKWGGNTTFKFWSPAAPLTYTIADGQTQRFYVNKLLQALTRPLDIINENSEIIPHYPNSTLEKDPAVHSAKVASGLDWDKYQGWARTRVSNAYSGEFMNLPGLQNTKFTEYGIDGQPTWRHEYSEARKCNDMIDGQYYATGDFYPRWPQNWRYWSAAWHGWQWVADSRRNEIAVGDRLFSPFVGAGWNNDPERNLRPAQWLALLKSMSVAGAEFFYTSFFAEVVPYQNPDNWAWQVVIPSYAQAVTSRYEDILRNGHLLDGDVPSNANQPNGNMGYSFFSGDFRKLINVRKHDNQDIYIIAASIQPNSNMMGNIESNSDAEILLDGNNIKFDVRKQGSVYYYDNTNPSKPVFYQLDKWHEYKHPSRWTKDFAFEGELHDNSNSNFNIKTERPNGVASGDFSDYTSYLAFDNAGAGVTAEYNFIVRENNPQYYLWVRARSVDGSSTGFDVELDNDGPQSIGCIDNSNWEWYRYDACTQLPITYTVSKHGHTLKITPINNKVEIDEILLTKDANLVLNSAGPNCSSTQASISANGPTTFCQGGSVTLTASAGTSYLWIPGGETTQSITVNASGTYSVIVGTGTGCSANAPQQTVTVTSPITASISSGASSFCQTNSITLSASPATTYLWSNGSQSSSITVTNAGVYTVTVTDAGGCTASAQITLADAAVFNNNISTVDAACHGDSNGSFDNNMSGGVPPYTYLWNDGSNQEDRNDLSRGSWTVTVTDANGCTESFTRWISSPGDLRILSGAVTPANCFDSNDGGFSPSAIGGTAPYNYLWNDGGTQASRSDLGRGVWTVTVTDANGCSESISNWVNSPGQLRFYANTVSPASCFTSNDGVFTNYSLGGVAPHTYLWTDGSTAQGRTDLSRGVWGVTVTDAHGCQKYISKWINSPSQLRVNATNVHDATCHDGEDGVIVTSTNGGTPGYTYLWNNGNTVPNRFNLGRGVHAVTVTDAAGCTKQISRWINHPPQMLLYASVNGPSTPTASDGIANVSVNNGGIPPFNYLWSNGSTSSFASGLPAGLHVVTVTDANGCTEVKSILVAYSATNRNIENSIEDLQISAFPNPSRDNVQIVISSPQSEKNCELVLTNALGKVVLTKRFDVLEGQNQIQLSLEQHEAALYYLRFRSNSSERSLRIVKL